MTEKQQAQKKIEDQALQWLSKELSGEMTPHQKDALRKWLNLTPKHQDAYQRIKQDLGLIEQALFSEPATQEQTTNHFDFSYALKIAASVILPILMLGGYILQQEDIDRIFTTPDHYTVHNETSEVILADNSTAVLNFNTDVNVDYSTQWRNIELIKGEAYFDVNKDPHRPFRVTVGQWQVEALGTEFSIRKQSDTVSIGVTEHSVRVTHLHNHRVKSYLVQTGEQLILTDNNYALQSLPKHKTSWIKQELVFDQATVADIIAELNLYYKGRIFLMDSSHGQKKLTLVIKLEELEDMLPVLAQTLNLKITKVTDLLVLIH